jgi:hypothetical protein
VNARTPVAPVPRTHPGAGAAVVLVAALGVGVGVVGVHDLLVDRGAIGGPVWVDRALEEVSGLQASAATTTAGAVLVVVGLVLVLLAVRRGRRTHVRADGAAETWVSPRALGALVRDAADRAPGVLHTEVVRASRRRIVLEVGARGGASSTVDREAVLAGARQSAQQEAAPVPGATVVVRLGEGTS